MPESEQDVFMSTSLLKSISEEYKEYKIYFCTKPNYFGILDGNPYIHKLIPYNDQMENFRGLQGVGDHKGYFDIVLQPYITTQRTPTYSRNGEDRVVYKDLKYQ